MAQKNWDELRSLAANLRLTAAALDRAAVILQAAGDLAAVEMRLTRALAHIDRPGQPGHLSATGPGAQPADQPAVPLRVMTGSSIVDRSRDVAVFDPTSGGVVKYGNKSAGGQGRPLERKTTAQDRLGSVRKVDLDSQDVPF